MADSSERAGDDVDSRRFLERFALLLSDSGYPRMAARVFAALFVSGDGRRTAAELAEILDVGPSAISGAVKYLVRVGMVSREREPGQRVDHYRVHQAAWFKAATSSDEVYRRFQDTAHDGVGIFGADTSVGARFGETERFFAFLRAEVPKLMAKWRELSERPSAEGHGG